jgi:6-methylsalicylate decarboxylase
MLAFATPGHLRYGSDSPFAAEPWGAEFDVGLDGYPGCQPSQLQAVNRGSAEALFPRLVRTPS